MICRKTKGSLVEKLSANGVLKSPQKEKQKRNVKKRKGKIDKYFKRKVESGKEKDQRRENVKYL